MNDYTKYKGNIIRHNKRGSFYTIANTSTFNTANEAFAGLDRKELFLYCDLNGEHPPQAREASELLDGRFEVIYTGHLSVNQISNSAKRIMSPLRGHADDAPLKFILRKFGGTVRPINFGTLVEFEETISANVATACIDKIRNERRIMSHLGASSRKRKGRLDTFDCFFGAMMYLDMGWLEAARFASSATDLSIAPDCLYNSELSYRKMTNIILATWARHTP